MNKLFIIAACIIIAGCSTSFTKSSLQVTEYQNIVEMNRQAQCTSMGNVSVKYNVLKISPLDRASAASGKLKDVAFKKGANAVIVTSTIYGDNIDKTQGEAYKCFLRRDWYEWELKLLNDEFKTTTPE